jgi:hypothetical protein
MEELLIQLTTPKLYTCHDDANSFVGIRHQKGNLELFLQAVESG